MYFFLFGPKQKQVKKYSAKIIVLEYFFPVILQILTVGQNNFENKMPLPSPPN
jgi:hypothetical protein